ncbi:MAG: Gfo/Idh/MocA family oxidoreductase [Armatimonadetes bacterium]|nr:Gfo/Idh/MocA family oxidoreductase [Armatimonadota bacterium]
MLGVAIVGARRGLSLVSVFQAHPATEVTVVCDVVAERAEAQARAHSIPHSTSSFDEVCASDEVDLVYIASPPPAHVPQSVQALAAGKHVLSEVPALWKPEEAAELVRAVRASSARYMMAENMAYFAWVQSYDSMVREGFIGEPVYAECEYVHSLPERMIETTPTGERKPTWRASLGPAQYCTHDLGPILRMFDDRVQTVVGMNTGSHLLREPKVIDAEVILCHTVRGRVIKFLGSFVNARPGSLHYFSLYGTRGVLESPRTTSEPHRLWSDRIPYTDQPAALQLGASHPHLTGKVPGGGHGTSEWLMVDDFVRAIEKGVEPPIGVYDALDWSLPGLLGHLSAEEGSKPYEVPDLRALAD